MTSRLENILTWILRGGLALSLLAPLVHAKDFFFPYIVPRAIFLQLVAAVLFGVSIMLMAFFPHRRPQRTSVNTALLVYFAIAIITTITSAEPSKSFIGTIERSFGLWHLLHFGMIFLAARLALLEGRQWEIFFTVALGISLYPALDFLLPQFFSIAPNSSSMMGNPLYLAGYSIFHCFFALFLLARQKEDRIRRGILVIITAIHAFTIIATGIRGAFLGLAASLVFMCCYGAWRRPSLRKKLAIVMIMAALSYLFIFFSRNAEMWRHNFVVQKITNYSLNDPTIASRLSMWKMGLQGLADRPIQGWGRENFSLVFNTHFDPAFNGIKVSEGWEDRSHNIFMDELVGGGVLGFTAYLFLLISAFWATRKSWPFLALLIAYTVQNLFGVENMNTSLPFFLLLAWADFSQTKEMAAVSSQRPRSRLSLALAGVALILVTLATGAFTLWPALGNYQLREATVAVITRPIDFVPLYKAGNQKLALFSSLQREALSLMVSNGVTPYGSKLVSIPLFQNYLEQLRRDFERLALMDPREEYFVYALTLFYGAQGSWTGNDIFFQRAEEVLLILLKRNPERALYRSQLKKLRQLRASFTSRAQRSP